MEHPAIPADESERLRSLHSLHILDTPPEDRFDRLTRLASYCFQLPIATVSLIDSDRQWFKSRVGVDASETPRSQSFCGHAILHEQAFIVPDALADRRFFDNPLVIGPPHIRFYAGQPLHSPSGHRIGTLCVMDREPRDFGEEERTQLATLANLVEQALHNRRLSAALDAEREATRQKQILVSAMTHDLRTPLTAIKGALGLLQAGTLGELPDKVHTLVQVAGHNSDRMLRLINDLLDYDKLAAGQMRFKYGLYDIAALLEEAIAAMATYGLARGVTYKLASVPRGILVNIDRDRIYAVLENLLSNAGKFTPENTSVVAGCERLGEVVRVTIRDQGPGISPELAPHLFQRFVQGARQSGQGTGLGLAICKYLVENHGGLIGFENQRAGGCSFYFELPVAGTRPERLSTS